MRSINKSKAIPIITQREKEIINLIVYEYSTKEIAQKLFIGAETVKSHRSSIMTKLDVKNVAGIVREAFYQNLISVNADARVA